MNIQIEKTFIGGAPVLKLTLDGRTAWPDTAPGLLRKGLLYLGPEWEDSTQAVMTIYSSTGETFRDIVRGATDDPAIISAVRAFLIANPDCIMDK